MEKKESTGALRHRGSLEEDHVMRTENWTEYDPTIEVKDQTAEVEQVMQA
jgi:hypothetical protein